MDAESTSFTLKRNETHSFKISEKTYYPAGCDHSKQRHLFNARREGIKNLCDTNVGHEPRLVLVVELSMIVMK